MRAPRRQRFLAAAAALLVGGCASMKPFQPADAGSAVRGQPATAEADVAGAIFSVQADDWRDWLNQLQARLTPVAVTIRNGSESALAVDPQLFTLVLPGGGRRRALYPAEVQRLLPGVAPWASGLRAPPTGPPPDRALGLEDAPRLGLQSWPGVQGRGSAYPPPWRVGRDARPGPEGVVEAGRTASFLLFFDVPADGLASFVFEATAAVSAGATLGVARLSFRRG